MGDTSATITDALVCDPDVGGDRSGRLTGVVEVVANLGPTGPTAVVVHAACEQPEADLDEIEVETEDLHSTASSWVLDGIEWDHLATPSASEAEGMQDQQRAAGD